MFAILPLSFEDSERGTVSFDESQVSLPWCWSVGGLPWNTDTHTQLLSSPQTSFSFSLEKLLPSTRLLPGWVSRKGCAVIS